MAGYSASQQIDMALLSGAILADEKVWYYRKWITHIHTYTYTHSYTHILYTRIHTYYIPARFWRTKRCDV
jgi:hypothetical protein